MRSQQTLLAHTNQHNFYTVDFRQINVKEARLRVISKLITIGIVFLEHYKETITCGDIHQAGEVSRTFTPELLQSLSVEDFKDCAEELGAIGSWSKEQLAALVVVAKKVSCQGMSRG